MKRTPPPDGLTNIAPKALDLDKAREKVLRESVETLRGVLINLANAGAFHECHEVARCAEQLQQSLLIPPDPDDFITELQRAGHRPPHRR